MPDTLSPQHHASLQLVTQCWHEYGQKPGWYARLACGCVQQLQYGTWLSAPTRLPCAHHHQSEESHPHGQTSLLCRVS